MLNAGKCPKCDKIISSVALEKVDVRVEFESQWRGVSYCCPSCKVVLSVAIDPATLKADISNEVANQLRK